jgi:hypothetical protein
MHLEPFRIEPANQRREVARYRVLHQMTADDAHARASAMRAGLPTAAVAEFRRSGSHHTADEIAEAALQFGVVVWLIVQIERRDTGRRVDGFVDRDGAVELESALQAIDAFAKAFAHRIDFRIVAIQRRQ